MESWGGQPEFLKEANRARVFSILQDQRRVARSELVRATGLSRATIAVIVDDFLQLNLVKKVGLGNSRGGRPPVLLEFNPDAAYVIGAGMHDLQWSVVVTNLDAAVVDRETSTMEDTSPDSAVQSLYRGVTALLARVDTNKLLAGIGVGSPGLVDIRTGVVKSAVDIGWTDVPLAEMVHDTLGMRAIVANRSKVGALAEIRYEGNRGIRDLIYIAVGTGVAAGIIHDGDLYVGTNSSAGELGHTTVIPGGPSCACGNQGCLQELVAEHAIANRARRLLRERPEGMLQTQAGVHPEHISADDVIRAAELGDCLAQDVVSDTAQFLAIAVANLINLFNPEMIVLGGPVGQTSRFLVTELQREVAQRAMAYPMSAVTIVQSSLGVEAGAIGAAGLVLQSADRLVFSRR